MGIVIARSRRLKGLLGAAFVLAGVVCSRGSSLEVVGNAPAQDADRVQVGSTAKHAMWMEKSGPGTCVVFDGTKGSVYDGLWASETMSPDGERFAYSAYKNHATAIVDFVVVDGKEEQINGKHMRGPVFSADSHTVASSVQTNSFGAGLAWEIVVKGPGGRRTIPATSDAFAISADGSRIAYSGGTDNRHSALVVEGTPEQRYPVSDGWSIKTVLFSDDGKRAACVIADSTHEACVLDGVEGPIYHQIASLAFSPDGSKFVTVSYGFESFHQQFLFVNGAEVGKYSSISLPAFSRDGKRMAFLARDADVYPSQFVVIDGKPERTHPEAGRPVISKDGKHIAYAIEDSRQHACVVLDGVNGPMLALAQDPVLSAIGDRIAYCSINLESVLGGKVVMHSGVVIDGIRQKDYQWVGNPFFSDDGRHVAYCARADGHSYLIADGAQSIPFNSWLSTKVYFDQAGAAHCMGVKDGKLVRVSCGGK